MLMRRRHDIDVTWFGVPILTVTETYLDGHARLALPFGVVENEPFDESTDLIRQMEALRFKAAADGTRTPWRIEPLGWQMFRLLMRERS